MTPKEYNIFIHPATAIKLLFLLWRCNQIFAIPASPFVMSMPCDESITNCPTKGVIQLCCPSGQVLDRGCRENETFSDALIEVRSDLMENSTKYMELYIDFDYKIGKPCDQLMVLTPETYADDEWILLEVSEF